MRTLTDIDRCVSKCINQRRLALGISQNRLARCLGVSQPQLLKYEKGTSCISAGKLFALSKILDVPMSFFFEEWTNGELVPPHKESSEFSERSVELVQLAQAYFRISAFETRKTALKFILSLTNDF